MTELQLGLIGLGVLSVVGVVAYNTWQEYTQRKLAEEVLKTQHADVLLEEEPVAMAVSGDSGQNPEVAEIGCEAGRPDDNLPDEFPPVAMDLPAAALVHPGERIEPVLACEADLPESREPRLARPSTGAELDVAVQPLPVPEPVSTTCVDDRHDAESATRDSVAEPHHLLSPVIDYVAAFESVEPSAAGQILELQRDTLSRLRKPVHWIGYNERSREWEPIIDDGESDYRSVRIGLQLVDRQGPVSDAELSMFHVAMQDISHELMAIADFPPCQPALDAAAKLDEFCASVDIQIGINVISRDQVFQGTKLRAMAEAAGMVIDADGRFVRCDDDGNVLYVLLNQETSGFSPEAMKTLTTHGITFLLDVPAVAHGERVFNQMVDLARRFADVLHGALVDDNRRPLSETALLPIRRQVGQFQSMMADHGLPAGGALARRLFS